MLIWLMISTKWYNVNAISSLDIFKGFGNNSYPDSDVLYLMMIFYHNMAISFQLLTIFNWVINFSSKEKVMNKNQDVLLFLPHAFTDEI